MQYGISEISLNGVIKALKRKYIPEDELIRLEDEGVVNYEYITTENNFSGEESIRLKMIDVLQRNYPIPTIPGVFDSRVLKNYSFFYDKTINDSLRKEKIAKPIEEMVRQIEKEIENADVFTDIVLFRGSELKNPLKVGDRFSDKGFMSKSSDPVIAQQFSKNSFFILNYVGESQHLFIAPFSRFPQEKEFLTYPGENFKVKAVFTYAQNNYYYCNFLGYDKISLEILDFPPTPRLNGLEEAINNHFVAVVRKNDVFTFSFNGKRKAITDSEENLLPIGLLVDEEYEDLERRILGSFYGEDLLGVYIVQIPKYGVFEIKVKDGELETTKREDIFYWAYCLITNNFISAEGSIPDPIIKKFL